MNGFTGRAPSNETDQDAHCRTKHVIAAVGTMLSLTGSTPTTIVVFSSGLSTPGVKKVTLGARGDAGTNELCPVEPQDLINIGNIAAAANVDLYLFQVVDGLAGSASTLDAGFESLAGVTAAQYSEAADKSADGRHASCCARRRRITWRSSILSRASATGSWSAST